MNKEEHEGWPIKGRDEEPIRRPTPEEARKALGEKDER